MARTSSTKEHRGTKPGRRLAAQNSENRGLCECLRCEKEFLSIDTKLFRICNNCKNNNPDLFSDDDPYTASIFSQDFSLRSFRESKPSCTGLYARSGVKRALDESDDQQEVSNEP